MVALLCFLQKMYLCGLKFQNNHINEKTNNQYFSVNHCYYACILSQEEQPDSESGISRD